MDSDTDAGRNGNEDKSTGIENISHLAADGTIIWRLASGILAGCFGIVNYVFTFGIYDAFH